MNLISWLVIVSIIVLVILDIIYISNHGIDTCGGNCSSCGGKCKWVGDIAKAKKAIERKKKLRAFLHLDKSK